MNKNKEMKELEELCKPVAEYLQKNWDPHCTVVITDSHIKLVRDEIGIPVRTAQEVPVQEQLSKGEATCIYRHLKAFVDKEWNKKENVPDACTECNHYCNSEDRQVLNPWIAFYKLSQLANEPYFGREGADK